MHLMTAALIALLACSDKEPAPAEDTAPGGGGGGDTALSDEDGDGDGYSPADGDCDDGDPTINPGQPEEQCDGIDQNCDGVDLDDVDGDGYRCEGAGGDDCDDYDPAVNPGAEDICGDGVDVNCDGDTECDCDGDSYEGALCGGDDCDDGDPAIYPWAPDDCYDGIDADCNGVDDYDCDGDGYASADYGGDDCDDANYLNYPGAEEICYDGMDNDCSADTPDCDCDGDGAEAETCGGDDCDDSLDTVYAGATEAYADNLDNDCDSEVDEGAYCHPYAPLTNITTGANKVYDVVYDGNILTETVSPSSYDPKTGEAVLERQWSGALSYDFTEYWNCAEDEVALEGWDASVYGIPLFTITFGSPRVDLVASEDLLDGASWSYSYLADDPAFGTMWQVEGELAAEGLETISVGAGTFEALVLTNTYTLTNSLGGSFDRSGVVRMYYVEHLGLVYSEDVTDEGAVFETRELSSYTEFYP